MPIRIQRKRVKGWKMPENTVCVTRGTEYGNPFKVGGYFRIAPTGSLAGFSWVQSYEASQGFIQVRDNEHAVEMYKEYLSKFPISKEKLEKIRGKNLACFCKEGQICHADVLIELANK